jgi:hypothetical protein
MPPRTTFPAGIPVHKFQAENLFSEIYWQPQENFLAQLNTDSAKYHFQQGMPADRLLFRDNGCSVKPRISPIPDPKAPELLENP